MIVCPVCNQRAVGKVGADQYYCWECCVEFVKKGQTVTVFNVGLDGSLSLFGDSEPEVANIEVGGVVECAVNFGRG